MEYYGETRWREMVAVTEELRRSVREMFAEMHKYFDRQYTPKVKPTKACASCSLKDICLPKLGKTVPVNAYIQQLLDGEGS